MQPRSRLFDANSSLNCGGRVGDGMSYRGETMRRAYRNDDIGVLHGHGGDVPGAKGCYYCWTGEYDKCKKHRSQTPNSRRLANERTRSRSRSRSRSRARRVVKTSTAFPTPSLSDRNRYLSEAEATNYAYANGHSGYSRNEVFDRTSYAKQSESCVISPFTTIKVFPSHHKLIDRTKEHSGHGILTGKTYSIDNTPSSYMSSRHGSPTPSYRSTTPRSHSMTRYAATPRSRVATAADRGILRGISSGSYQIADDLPLPSLFVRSP